MTTHAELITHDADFYYCENATPVRVTLVSDSLIPQAVTFIFHTGRTGTVTWVVDRSILTGGLTEQTGLGDIKIAPYRIHHLLILTLRGQDQTATFQVYRDEIEEFLTATHHHTLNPPEPDWDRWLRDITTEWRETS